MCRRTTSSGFWSWLRSDNYWLYIIGGAILLLLAATVWWCRKRSAERKRHGVTKAHDLAHMLDKDDDDVYTTMTDFPKY